MCPFIINKPDGAECSYTLFQNLKFSQNVILSGAKNLAFAGS